MKRYNIINNALGWLAFIIAAVTYLLTVEPTASFWDCPEFIAQGFKLEVGHPPGNPIFMLTARFFVTLFGGEAANAALAVNCMSALLSAGTILLLFWTVTHLVKRLIVPDDATSVSPVKTLVIMAAGMCGALAYTWSDTFWFSAVEGEVYAFSSFCTALVFWLILKWENRADQPHSDRYLVLIAYIIGISIAVHLLNLLCIPAIVLVFYYKKCANPNVKGSLLALLLSAVIVFFILYGLVPGFIAVAQKFELLFVNSWHMPYNSGVLAYALLAVAVFVWTIWQLYRQKSAALIKVGMLLSVILSGMPFIGHGWIIPTILIAALVVYLWMFCKRVPVRVFNVIAISIMVIFIGYSSYALLLIRASADTPMNQNSPSNVFALASYLNREQYGENPLFYGQTIAEELDLKPLGNDADGNPVYGVRTDANGYPATVPVKGIVYEASVPLDNGSDGYAKVAKTSPDQPDQYVKEVHRPDYVYSPDMKMLFTRMYSPDERHVRNYKSWAEYTNPDFESIPVAVRHEWAQRGYVLESELRPYLNNLTTINMGTINQDGYEEPYTAQAWKLGPITNLRYFLNYQLNHMYWRYFMWNFAGRQNDIQGNGEPQLGNWISGIPVIDNARLGDQSLLPDEFGKGNAGHNVFYMLPLLLGVIGLLWQALSNGHANPRRGIEQFWVIFFLFFMTGIAIVLYLNQTPGQPRERDYAFAGSFYAFAIWIGIGVPAVYYGLRAAIAKLFGPKTPKADKTAQPAEEPKAALPASLNWTAAAIAAVIGLAIPVQMVSQTWDDHDRSGRYTTRDFGMNYLNSLDPNAIIFTNGDNDTFPLWYAQEVEGERTDVRVVNLSYLTTDWYANQLQRAAYEAAPVPTYARPLDYAYDKLWMQRLSDPADSLAALPRDAAKALPEFYAGTSESLKRLRQKYSLTNDESTTILADANLYARLDSAATARAFGRVPAVSDPSKGLTMDLRVDALPRSASLNTILSFDIIAHSAADGWKRPVYFASTVPATYYMGFAPAMYTTGMAKQVTPFYNSDSPVIDKAYRNIMSRFRWGGLDSGRKLYLDETVRRMVSSTRLAILEVANELLDKPTAPASKWATDFAANNGQPATRTQADMARNLLALMDAKMPATAAPYESMLDLQMAETYGRLWQATGAASDLAKARQYVKACQTRYSQLVRYAASLSAGKRAALGAADRQALQYLTIAVGFENYLDLRQAMIRAKAPQQEIQALDSTFAIDNAEVYELLYLMNATDEQLEHYAADDYYSRMLLEHGLLRQLHSRYAVNPMQRTDSVAKAMSLTRDTWRRAIH
ncbi:MAG: DUF2723 domain-containing protein [Muribaculaceae bacterium]|nr:DUF2723 domain-containing protein [Muribaculaceae bacterium]